MSSCDLALPRHVGLIADQMQSDIERAQMEAPSLESKNKRRGSRSCFPEPRRHPGLLIGQLGNSELKEGARAHRKKSCARNKTQHTLHQFSCSARTRGGVCSPEIREVRGK